MELRNEFSWSKSRSKKFADCKRLFWFDTYGMWGGWERTAPDRTRRIYRHHKLKNRQMWAGVVVHDAIGKILKAYRDGELLDPEEVFRNLKPRMRKDFADSKDGKYLEPGGSKLCALREHALGEEVAKEEWVRVADRAESRLRNFLHSEIFAKLKRVPTGDWLAIEEDEVASFRLGGVKVGLKIDAAFRSGPNVHVIDWRTGASEDELGPLHLAVSTLYARSAWLPPGSGSVVAGVCELAGDQAVYSEEVVTEADLQVARAQIASETEAMAALLSSSPADNVAVEDRYPGTETPKVCRVCNFHRLCPVSPLQNG